MDQIGNRSFSPTSGKMKCLADQLLSRAASLVDKFWEEGETEYVVEAVVLDRAALDLCPPGHPMESSALIQLAKHLCRRYKQLGGIDVLHEAIDLGQETLALCPPGHPDRATAISNLAQYLLARYDQLGGANDLDEAIEFDRDALALRPPGDPGRSTSLNNLAASLSTRYNKFGEIDDLNEAIMLSRGALALFPPELPAHRSTVLSNLSIYLASRYDQLGGIDDINEAIDLSREALALNLPSQPTRLQSLNNLACHLIYRYNLLGKVDDLNEAITLSRATLALCQPGHRNRPVSLSNISANLFTRYRRLGGIDDLHEAITLAREAFSLRPPGHPDRSMSLNNLAFLLSSRYERIGGIDDLDEAIVYGRDALALRPPGHPERSTSLLNLGVYLWLRSQRLSGIEDLNEAIDLDRAALMFRPWGHPGRSLGLCDLALHLFTRYNWLGDISDLNEAINLDRDALALCPPGHRDRSKLLENFAGYLRVRFTVLGQEEDLEEMFGLYPELQNISQTVSALDIHAVESWVNATEKFHHPTMLLAYETALRFLVEHLTTLPPLPQHLITLKSLTSSLAVDAFSACLRNQSSTKAIELLEQGRGVFWSLLIRLRYPLDDVVASGPKGKILADEFARLTSVTRSVLDSPGVDQHDKMCRLNVELQEVVSKIRDLPGLSRFLLPSLFSDLRRAASEGPVIIVNASQYSCDALITLADKDPIHIPLAVKREDIQNLSSRLHTSTELAKRLDVTKDLCLILRELWDQVVSPIVDVLRTVHPLQSRIWWCPTAEFSLLPLHAAGPYRNGEQNLSDLYISSYAPTLSALIRSRRPSSPSSVAQRKRFVAIGQASASGREELPCVGPELTSVGQLVDGPATFTRLEGQTSSLSGVVDALGQHDWVHFACHCVLNRTQPFESAFALHDGRFTIQRIIQCELENPEFAYLSANHTAVGDVGCPDEAIHLASAMQFAGFRSVIGTMGAMDDTYSNKVTSEFYKHIMDESGRLDHTRAAFALGKTMKSVDTPIDQRILYIHLGA